MRASVHVLCCASSHSEMVPGGSSLRAAPWSRESGLGIAMAQEYLGCGSP